MKKGLFIIAVLLTGACIWFIFRRPSHRLIVRTHFQNAQGLRPGARVRVDGLDVGLVKDIRVSAQPGNLPIEVRMAITTPYVLTIPSDAIARLQTDGVLGPTFVEIDTHLATGPPLADNGTLSSAEFTVSKEGAARALEVVGNAALKQAQKLREQAQPSAPAPSK